jgi:hypothetical protein
LLQSKIHSQEKDNMQFRRLTISLIALLAIAMTSAAAPSRQDKKPADKPSTSDPVAGSYEGIAKSEALGDIPIKVDLKNNGGKLSGSIDTPQGAAPITEGTYADGKVSLKFDAGGNEGTVTAQVKDDKIVGNWSLAGQTGTLELKRAGAMAAAPAKPAPSPAKSAGKDPLSGDWDCSADAQGMTFPFTMKLVVDGEKVTGESSSAQGTATISKGSWAAEKLNLTLDTPNGNITMTAVLKDGKLSGDFDFAGQLQGKWTGSKK